MPTVDVPVLEVRQNIGRLYVGSMKASDLFQIAEEDRIRLIDLNIPKYAGFQRALVPKRVEEIRDYLSTPRSTFPNALILSIDSEYIESWDDVGECPGYSTMKIRKEKGAVIVIDGQHRAAALDSAGPDFQVVVSIFVDMTIMGRAEIFAKINSTQKAVNPSIAFQLFGYSEERSPQRTVHEIGQALHSTKGSPFFKKLRMLGARDEYAAGTLSQAAFANELMRLFTKNPRRDENRLLRGEGLDDYPGYPLRSYFSKGDDRRILEIVWRYFFRVAETWADQWNDPTNQSILPKTTGYAAFMRVLGVWLSGTRADEVLENRGVREALIGIQGEYAEPGKRFLRVNYPAGNQGVILLRDRLLGDLELEG